MTERVKKNDFIELDYTAKLKDANIVFDTTIEEIAKKEGLFEPKMTFGSISVCVGQGQILPGLDSSLEGLSVGTEQEILLSPENAFGKKDAKLIKLMPSSAFRKQNINPIPGLQLNIDGAIGTVRTAGGGRTVVDFNHPFAGKDVVYKVNIKRVITDKKEKVLALLTLAFNTKKEFIDVDIMDGKAFVSVKKEFDQKLFDILKKRILSLIPEIKDVEFSSSDSKQKLDDSNKRSGGKKNNQAAAKDVLPEKNV